MATKREQIILALVAALAGTTGVGTSIYRNRQSALTRDDGIPGIVVRPLSEQPLTFGVGGSYGPVECTLSVAVDIFTRGDEPDAIADPIAESAYAKIMTDTTLGGKCQDITPGNVSWDLQSADLDAAILTMEFEIMYRHSYTDLST